MNGFCLGSGGIGTCRERCWLTFVLYVRHLAYCSSLRCYGSLIVVRCCRDRQRRLGVLCVRPACVVLSATTTTWTLTTQRPSLLYARTCWRNRTPTH